MQQNPANEYFSISEGGPFNNAVQKIGLNTNAKQVAVALCITWLPLLIITAFEGTIYSGVSVPFLKDVSIHVRLLIVLPILLTIKGIINSKSIDLEKYFSDTLMNDDEKQVVLNRELHRIKRLINSAIPEIIFILIIAALTMSPLKGGLLSEATSWRVEGSETTLSLAGKWVVFVSIPIFQFLILRWLWRYIIWALFIFRMAKTRLNLQPTHPDQCAGLGIVADVHKYFGLIFLAINIVASAEMITRIIKNPDSFHAIRGEAIGNITICVVLLFLPLFFFIAKLIMARHYALMDLGNVGATLSTKFEEEWIGNTPIEKKVLEGKVSTTTLQDYSAIYRSTEKMRSVPFRLPDVVLVILILFIPYIPILVIHYSIVELLQKLFGLLL
jgi:hypothetical protein